MWRRYSRRSSKRRPSKPKSCIVQGYASAWARTWYTSALAGPFSITSSIGSPWVRTVAAPPSWESHHCHLEQSRIQAGTIETGPRPDDRDRERGVLGIPSFAVDGSVSARINAAPEVVYDLVADDITRMGEW